MKKEEVFNKLKLVLSKYEDRLIVKHDKADNYYLNTPITASNKKSEFFGAVQVKKSYVAYHLMPIYYFPELLDNISDELSSRMQGKSCFNFNELSDAYLSELQSLTSTAFDKYKIENKV